MAKFISLTEREDEKGQTLVEYALIIALMSILLVGALTALKTGVGDVFSDIVAALGAAGS
jgi:pilus assembly protein Flp/PilA